jgi:hypothetical protein
MPGRCRQHHFVCLPRAGLGRPQGCGRHRGGLGAAGRSRAPAPAPPISAQWGLPDSRGWSSSPGAPPGPDAAIDLVGYFRTPTDDQTTTPSLGAKEAAFDAWDGLHGHELVEVFRDAGVSAKVVP